MIECIHGDALDLTSSDFAAYDALITDPPYSPHVHANAASVGVVGGGRGAHTRDLGFAHLSDPLGDLIAMGAAHVRRWTIVFSDLEGTHAWRARMAQARSEYVRQVPATYPLPTTEGDFEFPWIRWSQPQLSGDRPCSGSEAVLHFHRQYVGVRGGVKPIAKHWNGPGSLTHYASTVLRGTNKHPTEKPLGLMLSIVSWFTDPGERVIDPCGGRGTTALACRLLGRGCTSIELDETYARRAAARLESDLSDRDRKAAQAWVESTFAEALRVPTPKAPDGSDVKTYERASRRIADAELVEAAL